MPGRTGSPLGTALVAACLLALAGAQSLLQLANRHTVASIPGDLMIGALVPVHERPSPKQAQTRICGAVREQYGIQRVEVAFRTIDSINADPNILPNITLGIEIRDSCWHSPIALEQSIEFIRDAMAASEQSQKQSPAIAVPSQQPDQVNASQCPPHLLRQQSALKKVKNIVGVVGPASSTDTVQVQNLLQLFNMPQLGYSATSRDLSNKNFFKYFLRVVPSDKLQAQVMIDLMLAHNWTYITVAYTEGSYGSSLMNAFRERAQEVGICFATLESMPPNADDAKFDELIEAIQKHPNARVVICMCEGRTLGKLFAGFKRKNIINEYLVVGSDGWSDRFDVVEKQEEYALGGISIRIHSAYVDDFDDYYFGLNPFTNHRNPWFAEFWETRFQCNLEPSAAVGFNGNGNAAGARAKQTSVSSQQRPFIRPPGAKVYNRTCTGRESLRNNHKQDAKMAFVQKSIITMALGLDSMQRAICPSDKPGLCPEMLPVNGSILLAHLVNVSFSFLDERVSFDEQGDPPGRYDILNFQRRRPQQPELRSSAEDNFELDEDSDALPSSALAGAAARSEAEQRRRQNPLYDSYSTLRRLRPHNPTRRAARSQLPQLHPPASGYSSTSGYEYVHVGSWQSESGLSLFGDIHWPAWSSGEQAGGAEWQFNLGGGVAESGRAHVNTNLPKSVCALPCPQGHAKKIQSDSVKCCWVCVLCRPNEYLLNEFKCRACEKGWWPNSARTGCDQIPIQYLDWRSMEALTAISIALFGLSLTLATAFVFIRHNDTPVVKSTTRELSFMILFAMVLCYVTTFFLVAKPRRSTCFVTRILPGFAFAMMYGALVTKTNRIARILAGSKKKIITRRLRFMSATSQVAITWVIVLTECMIIVSMLVREPADSALEYPSDERVLLVCNTTTMGIIAPLGFDFFLIAMCTLYAFKTRNVPENFNEAKFIGFTMYTTLVIWIAFVVIYLSSEHKVTTLCLCISFSALFALFLLFFPRCYIILVKPEKNNRSFFTTTKNVRCHIGYQIGSAGAAAAAAAAATANQPPASQLAALFAAGNALEELEPAELAARESRLSRTGRTSGLHWQPSLSVSGAADPPSVWPAGRDSPKASFRAGPLGSPNSTGYWPEGGRAPLLRSLWGGLVALFSRRSRRKQFDKTLSIQQHLRAIRHAENLDRKTHFRRSQVQRLVQRFDFSLASEPGSVSWAAANLRQVADAPAQSPPDDHLRQLQLLVKSDDGAQLLLALGQLLGVHSVWRLAEALRRYCASQAQARQARELAPHFELQCKMTAPLDLDKLTDRALGLTMLRFLAAALRRAQRELDAGLRAASLTASAETEAPGERLALEEAAAQLEPPADRADSTDTIVVCKSSLQYGHGDADKSHSGSLLLGRRDRAQPPTRTPPDYHSSPREHPAARSGSGQGDNNLSLRDNQPQRHTCNPQGNHIARDVIVLPLASTPNKLQTRQSTGSQAANPAGWSEGQPARHAISASATCAEEDPIERALHSIMGTGIKEKAPSPSCCSVRRPADVSAANELRQLPANTCPDTHCASHQHPAPRTDNGRRLIGCQAEFNPLAAGDVAGGRPPQPQQPPPAGARGGRALMPVGRPRAADADENGDGDRNWTPRSGAVVSQLQSGLTCQSGGRRSLGDDPRSRLSRSSIVEASANVQSEGSLTSGLGDTLAHSLVSRRREQPPPHGGPQKPDLQRLVNSTSESQHRRPHRHYCRRSHHGSPQRDAASRASTEGPGSRASATTCCCCCSRDERARSARRHHRSRSRSKSGASQRNPDETCNLSSSRKTDLSGSQLSVDPTCSTPQIESKRDSDKEEKL